jgi:hypothetical protein
VIWNRTKAINKPLLLVDIPEDERVEDANLEVA